MIVIGVDTGGTFTDFIYQDGKEWKVYKVLSTPHNPAAAVLDGYFYVARNQPANITHGSTVATNALLERKGANTALITNKNFEDVIEIGRQNRSQLYNLHYQKTPPLVAKANRFGVKTRINHQGKEIEPLDLEELKSIIHQIEQSEIESVAVCLLFSFQNSSHEQVIGKELKRLGVFYSLSSEILPEFREYERLSTTVVNAYVSPKMTRYLSFLQERLKQSKLRVMQSNGGSISAQTAMQESVRTILSGPAGGVVGAYKIGQMVGIEKLITFDMGGTSTDVALVNGSLPFSTESKIAGFPVKIPMLDIHTVGAGGGSIANFDFGGALKVGPKSAGADPGPICYGNGEQITVTDANLYLGRLIPERFLNGNMYLKTERIRPYFEQMAAQAGLSPIELAEGILDVANANMEKAIRVISVEKGFDPRDFTLFAFGGGGPVHAVFLAKLLNIPQVFIPNHPGILSAIGMLLADVIKDYSQTIMLSEQESSVQTLEELFKPLEQKSKQDLLEEGIAEKDIILKKYLDIRYQGQAYELIVPFGQDFRQKFERLHEQQYGYVHQNKPIEVVNIRLQAHGILPKPEFKKQPLAAKKPDPQASLGKQEAVFGGKTYLTQLYLRKHLRPGNCIQGPAIIAEYSSTTVLPPEVEARIDEFNNIIVSV